MPKLGPVRLSVAGDTFTQPSRILAIIWEGSSTAGDTAEVADPPSGIRLWRGRASDTNTYLGGNIGPEGIHCPNGFFLKQISSGDVYVYLREN